VIYLSAIFFLLDFFGLFFFYFFSLSLLDL